MARPLEALGTWGRAAWGRVGEVKPGPARLPRWGSVPALRFMADAMRDHTENLSARWRCGPPSSRRLT